MSHHPVLTLGNAVRFWHRQALVLIKRLIAPASLVVICFVAGTLGFYAIGDGHWSLFDCAYMASITLTTVGYGEVLMDMGHDARLFAMFLMWAGMGVVLYGLSTVVAFVVESNLTGILRERRMDNKISAVEKHFIVCGLGEIGLQVAREMVLTGRPCLAVDSVAEHLDAARQTLPDLLTLTGDATEEAVLVKSGVQRAAGMVAALPDDGANMLITLQARHLNPVLKIGARCSASHLADKFFFAGANYVTNPAFIGAMRLASEMIRPQVVSFLDRMLRGTDPLMRVEEAVVEENSELADKTLAQANLRARVGLNVLGLKHPEHSNFSYNLGAEEILHPGTLLLIIGSPDQLTALRNLCQGS